MKATQSFSSEYLDQCKKMTPDQIIKFIEDFRNLYSMQKRRCKTKLISIKIPEDLLQAFKFKAASINVQYQTQIKLLMNNWLKPLK